MLKLKGCPKCKKGDVVLDRDHYGWYEYCIQCGYLRDLESMVDSGHQQAYRGSEGVRRIGALSKAE